MEALKIKISQRVSVALIVNVFYAFHTFMENPALLGLNWYLEIQVWVLYRYW